MIKISSLAIVPALVVGAAACAGPTIYNSYYASLYEPAQVRFAAAVGPTLAVIRDNPFLSDAGNERVLAAMPGQTFAARMVFSQTPRADDRYGYKVVLNFGSSLYGTRDACQAGPTPPARTPPPGRITASAAFCIGDALLSDAQGSVQGATGPDDPNFRRLIGDLLIALTPAYNPNRPERFGFGWM